MSPSSIPFKKLLGLAAIISSVLLLYLLCVIITGIPVGDGAARAAGDTTYAAPNNAPASIRSAPLAQTGQVTTDLSISQTLVAPGPFYPGQEVFYQLLVENLGTSVATSVTVTDVLPSQVVSTTVFTFGGSVTITQVQEGPEFVWQIASLESGQQLILFLRGIVDPTLSGSATLTNTAEIAGAGDLNPLNNQSQVTIDVVVPVLQFASMERQIQEDSPSIVISIIGTNAISESLPPSPYTDIFVDYTTVEGSATLTPPPGDFVAISATAKITQGLRSATLEIPINDDAIAEGTESFTVELSNPRGAELGVPNVLQIVIDDDESAGVRITPAELSATEDGFAAQYSIELRSKPNNNVTIQIQPDEQTVTSVSGVTFTPENWDQPQMIQVTAVDDDVSEDAHQGFIQHSANSADQVYNGVIVADVVVNIADNDGARIIPSTASLSLIEGGAPGEYELTLGSEPRNPVTVTVVVDDQLLVVPPALYFNAITWSVPQTVTVTAKDDIVMEEVHVGAIVHKVSSLDPVYHNIFAPGVTANIGDNDYSGILLSAQSIEITEGAPAGSESTYSVVLVSQPIQPVTVFVGASENLTATPTQLVFTPGNWAVAQPVAVQAADDNVVGGEWGGEIQHQTTSLDRYYNGLSSAIIQVNVLDNDQAALALDGSFPLQVVEEGAPTTYGISLQSQPTSTVTLAFIVDPNQLAVQPSVMAFEPDEWDVVRQVTVRAVDDGIAEGTHTAQLGFSVHSDDVYYDNLIVDPVSVQISDAVGGAGTSIFLPITRQ